MKASLTDTRPGLIHGKKAEKLQKQEQAAQKEREKREAKKNKYFENQKKNLATLMTETREDSLQTSIAESNPENKGLKLMMKMGFKVGAGLGKEGEGRKAPVPIGDVKVDKKGH